MIFKTIEDFTIGFHYSRLSVMPSEEFKGNEWGSNYSLEELLNFEFMTVEMLESFINLTEKMGDNLNLEFSDLHVKQYDDYYIIQYKDSKIKLLKTFLEWAKEELKKPNGELNGVKGVENEMRNKADIYYNKYHNIKEMPIEDVLLYVDSGQENRLREYAAV